MDLEQLAVEPDMALLVPEHLARRYQVFPVDLKDNRLTLAMHDPLDVIALDDIRLATGFDLDPVIAIKRDLQKLVHDQFCWDLAIHRRSWRYDLKPALHDPPDGRFFTFPGVCP